MQVLGEILAEHQRPRQTAHKSKMSLYLVRIIWNIDSKKPCFQECWLYTRSPAWNRLN